MDTIPNAGTCGCGSVIEPTWIPGRRWKVNTRCASCGEAAVESVRKEDADAQTARYIEHHAMLLRSAGAKIGCTLETFTAGTPSQQRGLEVITAAESSVWLWGSPGVGKTHLSSAAVSVDPPRSQLWLVADLLANLRKEAVDGDIEHEIALLRFVPLLVLDDLGVERPTPFVLECLYRVVDTRCDRGLRTIVTSNAKPSVVAKTLGARIHSRLLGMCEIIHIEGEDGRIGRKTTADESNDQQWEKTQRGGNFGWL